MPTIRKNLRLLAWLAGWNLALLPALQAACPPDLTAVAARLTTDLATTRAALRSALPGSTRAPLLQFVVDTSHAGEIHITRPAGSQTWYSGLDVAEQAVLGNPEWPFLIYGEELAAQLGFRRLGEDTIVFPSPERLQVLHDRLGVIHHPRRAGFWRQASDPLIPITLEPSSPRVATERGFLELVAANRIPIAESGLLAVHDFTFHVASILLPPRLWRSVRSHAEYLLALVRHIEAQDPEIALLIRPQIEEAMRTLGGEIDASLGNLGSGFLANDSGNGYFETGHQGVRELLLPGRARWSRLLRNVTNSVPLAGRHRERLTQIFESFAPPPPGTDVLTAAEVTTLSRAEIFNEMRRNQRIIRWTLDRASRPATPASDR